MVKIGRSDSNRLIWAVNDNGEVGNMICIHLNLDTNIIELAYIAIQLQFESRKIVMNFETSILIWKYNLTLEILEFILVIKTTSI